MDYANLKTKNFIASLKCEKLKCEKLKCANLKTNLKTKVWIILIELHWLQNFHNHFRINYAFTMALPCGLVVSIGFMYWSSNIHWKVSGHIHHVEKSTPQDVASCWLVIFGITYICIYDMIFLHVYMYIN